MVKSSISLLLVGLLISANANAEIASPDPKLHFGRVFSWGMLTDDNTVKRFKEIGVTDIRVANQEQLALTFLPEPLYGNRLKADFSGQTVAWYFPWNAQKIADYTRITVGEQNKYFDHVRGVPFVGLNRQPGSLWVKEPATLERELQIILKTGGNTLMVCNGKNMIEPGIYDVFRKYCREDLTAGMPAVKEGESRDVSNGIGTPLAGPHPTERTDRVLGESAGKVGNASRTRCKPGVGR